VLAHNYGGIKGPECRVGSLFTWHRFVYLRRMEGNLSS
jgi:hypothetical protein